LPYRRAIFTIHNSFLGLAAQGFTPIVTTADPFCRVNKHDDDDDDDDGVDDDDDDDDDDYLLLLVDC